MAIKPEKFDALVKKLENFSKHHPGYYRLQVALWAILGYAYIFLVLVGLLAVVGLIVSFFIFYRAVNTGLLNLLVMLLIPVSLILKSLWVTFPKPKGVKLSRRQSPQLFALVDELTTALQAPKFHNILLDREFNAAVVQIPRLGIFGWPKNYLLLGLPLMQSLSLPQLKAVLAHELGHLSGNHSSFAGWIYRIRQTWMQIYEQFHQNEQQDASVLFNGFLNWYWPSFNAYSFVLARMSEYEADRCAKQLAGAKNTADALINIAVKSCFLENSFWIDIQKQIVHQAEPPENIYVSMLTSLQSPISEENSQQWLEQALMEKTQNTDTHPCLTERLEALGYSDSIDRILKLFYIKAIQTPAAEQLLGTSLKKFTIEFSRDWKAEASTSWRQHYAYLQETKCKLEALEQKTQTQTLNEQQAWDRAYYTLELQGEEAAVPCLKIALEQYPDCVEANYTLGRILLKQSDEAGIELVEKAIAQKRDWVIPGCELIYNFLDKTGRTEEANNYQKQAEQHYQILLESKQERSIITKHDRFKPHSLEALEIARIKQKIVSISQIKEVYLVEKVLAHFPEDRCLILGIIRKQKFIESEDVNQKLLDRLIEQLKFLEIDYILVILNDRRFSNLKKKIRQIDRSVLLRH